MILSLQNSEQDTSSKIERTGMELFFRYLKEKRKSFILAAGCVLIFLLCFILYRLPVKAVLYPTVLSGMVCICYVIYDFRKVCDKYRKLKFMHTSLEMITEYLPKASGIEEDAYQQLIIQMNEEQKRLRENMGRTYSEMVDYYTVWAHQIKTPIAAMRLNLQNEDTALSRRLSMDLFHIEQYVEMVLMYLRLDSDSSDYVIKEYALEPIVRSAVKKFSGEFISRKIQLKFEQLEANVITDEKWLSFVIEQVLSNALKYTHAGRISIYMEEPKTLCIEDTGIGIAPEDLPRVFEKGYTGYNGRMDKKASGIGLYLCRRICSNLGHQISAVSEIDKGTVIRINLEQKNLCVE